jgi:hypothetical protein
MKRWDSSEGHDIGDVRTFVVNYDDGSSKNLRANYA